MSSRLGQAGFTLLEAVVATTVMVVGVVAVVGLTLVAKGASEEGRNTVQASNYLQEGLEAARTIRDADWTNVSTAGTYHLAAQAGVNPPWQLVSGGTETIGTYTRQITIASVRRADTNGDGQLSAGDQIVQSGGSFDDPDTKKITCVVSWQQGKRTVSRQQFVYLTNWQK